MCGIAGFLDHRRGVPDASLHAVATAMAAPLAHRGPDDAGAWVDGEAGIGLGHRRLAIVELSPLGAQPMVSGDGRWVLSYNGETYNADELRRRLESAAVRFRGHSDTEVLLEAIAAWGPRTALERANGMFALAAWDRRDRRLILARDRLGEKPLYYGWAGATLVFGSELKALAAHPDVSFRLDRNSVALYLRHGFVPAPWSIYEGIRKLPPATVLDVPLGAAPRSIEPETYWSPLPRGDAPVVPLSAGEAVEELDALLSDSVRLRMMSDVPLGAFLSGGIDSSAVVAAMQRQSATAVRTFTIGFHEDEYDEASHARTVARHLGTDHTEHYVTAQEALDVIPLLPTMYDEPFADSSQVPTHLVSRLARSQVTVALSGDGGDELFSGYDRYSVHAAFWRRFGRVPRPVRALAHRALVSVPPRRWDRMLEAAGRRVPRLRVQRPGDKVHKLAEMLPAAGPEAAYVDLMSYWKDPAAVVLGSVEPLTELTDAARWPPLAETREQLAFLDSRMYLPDDILVKLDRASMAVSLEARVPMLDHRLVELAWRLPLALKHRDGQSKWVLRQVLARYVPPALVERPKMGFGVPIGTWLRGPLRGWADDLLDAGRLHEEGILDVDLVRSRWHEHLAGDRDWKYQLWAVLMLEAWLQAEGGGRGR